MPLAEVTQQTPHSAPAATPSSAPVASPPAPTPPKVDYATDLFNMLSMDGSNENGSEAASADDNADWAGFQCMYLRVHVFHVHSVSRATLCFFL